MLELEVVPEHGLQGEAIEFLLGEIEIGEKPQIAPINDPLLPATLKF